MHAANEYSINNACGRALARLLTGESSIWSVHPPCVARGRLSIAQHPRRCRTCYSETLAQSQSRGLGGSLRSTVRSGVAESAVIPCWETSGEITQGFKQPVCGNMGRSLKLRQGMGLTHADEGMPEKLNDRFSPGSDLFYHSTNL